MTTPHASQHKSVTDDIDLLLDILPPDIREWIERHNEIENLLGARCAPTSASTTRTWSSRRSSASSSARGPGLPPAQPGRSRSRDCRAACARMVPEAPRDGGPRPDGREAARAGHARRSCAARPTCWCARRSSSRASTFRRQHADRRARGRARPGPALPDQGPGGPLRERAYAYLLYPSRRR